jgi:GST-like protein
MPAPIQVWTWPTPNGHKVHILLEELGLPYEVVPVAIGKGEQFRPEFLAIAPNNRIPAIVDHDAPGGPVALFESGAILLHLADRIGRFIPPPAQMQARAEVLQWLFWQMGGLGPMAGQNHHFRQYAPEKIPYAIERYMQETNRLYGVLDRRLAGRDFIAGDDYSIADMACYPWIVPHERQGQRLEDFAHLRRWFEAVRARPATQRAYARAKEVNSAPTVSAASAAILFGQTAANTEAR